MGQKSEIKKIIAVTSGKGGVGKSFVTSLLSVNLSRQGYKVGILDADITGPSIPKIFGINKQRAIMIGDKMQPVESEKGIKIMSLNLLLEEENQPVIWRGPLVGSTAKQLYEDTNWGELDYLVIDMPPGTSDVTLTVMQTLPIDNTIIVTSPQDLVGLIVQKSIIMTEKMGVPILGLVENMSYALCPDCGKAIQIFGESKAESVAQDMNIKLIDKLPLDSYMTGLCDTGKIEHYEEAREKFAQFGRGFDL